MTEENTRTSTDSSSNIPSVGWTPDNDSLTSHSGWFVVLGVSLIILGILAIALPTIASAMTVLFLGWILLIGGIIQGVHAFTAKKMAGFFRTSSDRAAIRVCRLAFVDESTFGHVYADYCPCRIFGGRGDIQDRNVAAGQRVGQLGLGSF